MLDHANERFHPLFGVLRGVDRLPCLESVGGEARDLLNTENISITEDVIFLQRGGENTMGRWDLVCTHTDVLSP